MRRRLLELGMCVTATFALVEVAACGLEVAGTADAVDASLDVVTSDSAVEDVSVLDASGDASADAAPLVDADANASDGGFDASDCVAGGGFVCGQTCVSSCRTCALGNTACNATRVCGVDCSLCAGQPYAFYDCVSAPPTGFCLSTKCDTVTGLVDCACNGGDAAACPGATQICSGGGTPVCKTCGSGGTDKKMCANGTQCKESSGLCR